LAVVFIWELLRACATEPLPQPSTLNGAIWAFTAGDAQRDAAWKHLILLIDDSLKIA
jgi:hypothetical protein